MHHECHGFAWVLGIGVAGAEVNEVGSSSMGNGLAQAGFAGRGRPIQQHGLDQGAPACSSPPVTEKLHLQLLLVMATGQMQYPHDEP